MTNMEKKEYFNYSVTSRNGEYESPISEVSLAIDKSIYKIKEIDIGLLKSSFCKRHFPKLPNKKNSIFAFPYSYAPIETCPDIGVHLNELNPVLKVKYEDLYYNRWKDSDPEIVKCKDEFKLIVYILTLRKLVIDIENGVVEFQF